MQEYITVELHPPLNWFKQAKVKTLLWDIADMAKQQRKEKKRSIQIEATSGKKARGCKETGV